MKIKKQGMILGIAGCLAFALVGCGKKETLEATTRAVAEAVVNVETAVQESKVQETPAEETVAVKETKAIVVETNEAIPEDVCGVPLYIDHVVSEAILEEHVDHYAGGECHGEGHIILEEAEEDGISTVYALIMYGVYEFQNVDYFIKTAGTGVIPVVMQFDLRLSSHTPCISFTWPMDGSLYTESIKTMFPEHLWDRTLSIQEEDRETLETMERGYAEQYLKEIGRDAVIGDYADVEHVILTDLGVSVEVSNKLSDIEKYIGPYPYWQGSTEKMEDGVRYLYSMFYDEETDQIIYEKRVFDTHETVEKFVYDAKTGEEIENESVTSAEVLTDEELEAKVSEIILSHNGGYFTSEECKAEGHIILGTERDGWKTKVYALTMYGEYQFQNVDYFIKTSGTGVIPAVLTFGENPKTGTDHTGMAWPDDGSGYNESVKEMFPEEMWERTLTIQDEDREVLEAMERVCVQEHLKMAGRDAVIGDYADVENRMLLTDYGISVDVSNKMLGYQKDMGPYPDWVGSLEKIEDGERYLYSVFVDEETDQIVYEKRVFGTREMVEKFAYDAKTGDPV